MRITATLKGNSRSPEDYEKIITAFFDAINFSRKSINIEYKIDKYKI